MRLSCITTRKPPKPHNELTSTERMAFKEWNHKYRQRMAETATVAFRQFLSQVESMLLHVVTAVDKPGDVLNVYARFVGDILVNINGEEVNLNTWLIRSGLALPTFYNSW